MKYCIIVPDGMADYPIAELDGKTPMEVARTKALDELAKIGEQGLAKTVPDGFVPASDVANLSLFGYDPRKCYSGRAPLEAANMGVKLHEDEVAFRCNFITVSDGKLVDFCAGHISTGEADTLIKLLNKALGSETIRFYTGVSYRHLTVIKSGFSFDFETVAPHDIMGQPYEKYMPKGKGSEIIIDLMNRSRDILANVEINNTRVNAGDVAANMIWLWGQGKTPSMESFFSRFGVKGAVISAVNLIHGIAVVLGMEKVVVEGATGFYDTNYKGKGAAAIEALKNNDLAYVHIEAPDEAGHNGELDEKIKAIENIDTYVIEPVLDYLKRGGEYRILVAPDHFTPISKRTHSNEPVPYVLAGSEITASGLDTFSERNASRTGNFWEGHTLIARLFEH